MPRKAQPVKPIYQPEVAAQAILRAADGRQREYWVAPITALTILGDKGAPGLLDRYLGRTGYNGQQTKEAEPREKDDNLFSPVGHDGGAHGVFDDVAKPRTWEFLPPAIPRAVVGVGRAVTQAGTRLRLPSGPFAAKDAS